MKRALILILLVVLLLAGCTSNGARVEELQSEIAVLQEQLAEAEAQVAEGDVEQAVLEERLAEAEAQIAEGEARQDKNEAIVEFADQGLELRSSLLDIGLRWRGWYHQNLPDGSSYARYSTGDKEYEAINEAEKLHKEVKSVIATIEQLYAPPEAIETKKKLLIEGDSLQQAFVDIIIFYCNIDSPNSLYYEAFDFMFHGLGKIDIDVRRELVDLGLEYGQ